MKANFIIIKMLVYMRVIVETATGYTIENIKEYGGKEEGVITNDNTRSKEQS